MAAAGRTVLLVIDPQVDFHEGGSLAVPGATADSQRVAALIRECGSEIDEIYITLDTHTKHHIAHAVVWKDKAGNSPLPFTLISHQDVVDGTWSVRPDAAQPWLQKYAEWYTARLEAREYRLIIWPEHCVVGSVGHTVQPDLFAAAQAWSQASRKDTVTVLKGLNPLTEMYSAVAAEVPLDEAAVADIATAIGLAPGSAASSGVTADESTTLAGHADLLAALTGPGVGRLVVCGQALSHCVKSTVLHLLQAAASPDFASRIVLLRDGASPVAGFEANGEAFVDLVRAGGGRALSCAELAAELALARSQAQAQAQAQA